MYSKEEAKAIRTDFWEGFRRYTLPRKQKQKLAPGWIMENTGINALALRFSLEDSSAMVGIDLETNSMEKKIELYDKLETLKKILHDAMGKELIWDLDYTRENGKSVSRIYTRLDNVTIYDRNCWDDVYKFFYKNMRALETFYEEYRDYLKYTAG
jgi:deoxyribodipyrimidine photolyase